MTLSKSSWGVGGAQQELMRLINWFISLKEYLFIFILRKKNSWKLEGIVFQTGANIEFAKLFFKKIKIINVAGVSAPLTEFGIGEQCAANFKTQTKNFLNFQVNQYLVIERKETYLLAHSNLLPRLIAIRQRIYVVNLISILNCHQ